jgi:hypothetical protein
MPLSAADCISPAFEHVKQQLFRPFSITQWTLLALVGLFAGESCSGSGFNFNSFNVPKQAGTHRDFLAAAPPDWSLLAPLIAIALIAIPIVWLLLMYLNSRMRFVLFDSVIAKRCEIGRMWRGRREPALQYFIWQIVLSVVMLAGMAILIGIPLLGMFLLGWLTAPRQHIGALVLSGVAVFFIFLAWLLLSVLVHVFTKDFVVPQMALENISAFEGWRRLLVMLRSDKRGYAGYGGLKLILAMGATFSVAILGVIAVVILLIPFGGLAAITVIAGKVGGLTWNVFTITAAVVAGSVFLAIILYVVSLISVPVIVFFPAYSIYFFGSRYPQLSQLLYPPPPAPILPIAPEPIGGD